MPSQPVVEVGDGVVHPVAREHPLRAHADVVGEQPLEGADGDAVPVGGIRHRQQGVVGEHVGDDVEEQVVARVGAVVGEGGEARLRRLRPRVGGGREVGVGEGRGEQVPGSTSAAGTDRSVQADAGAPGQRRETARPEAQADDPPPAAHVDVEAPGAHAGDGDGLVHRHPRPRVAAELDGQGARRVREDLAGVPAAGGEVPGEEPPVLHPALGRRRRPARARGRRGGRTRRAAARPAVEAVGGGVAFVLSGTAPSLGRVGDIPTVPDERHHHGTRHPEDAHPRQLRRPARRDASGRRCSAGRSRTSRTSTRCSPGPAAWRSGSGRSRTTRRRAGRTSAAPSSSTSTSPSTTSTRGWPRASSWEPRFPDEQPGETWRVLLDPSGHPFCLTLAANWG